jgi:hypothetical protein
MSRSFNAEETQPAAESRPESNLNERSVSLEPEVEQERSDADLEASVLDTLTDTVLTGIHSRPATFTVLSSHYGGDTFSFTQLSR